MSASNNGNSGSAEGKRPLRDGIDDAKHQIGDIAATAADRARNLAGDARESLSGGAGGSPLLALAGGMAVGVLVGALLPRTEREGAVLGALGARLIDAAHEAADAAREVGRDKLDEAGLSRNGARDAVRGMLDAALGAAFSAGNAAADAAKQKVTETRD
ncbi:hypothetical protein [Sphingomonas sp.]|uniref:hypothetical protein n=1 Tax=Sphingomonas sp. TaxID=28214 RepID=UPI003B00CF42